MNLHHHPQATHLRHLLASLALLISGCAQAQVSPGMSPIVTWDAEIVYGGVGRTPTTRPLAAGEVATAKRRAGRFFDVLKAVPAFSQPTTTATYLTSWAVVNDSRLVEQQFIAYASNPRDVRRRTDGALWGVMGGVHQLLFMYTNRAPNAANMTEREHSAFTRQVDVGGPTKGFFVQPRLVAEVGGGQLYGSYLILTREGQPALAPAPIGTLLETDIAFQRKTIADQERGWANSLRELEASMTPEAITARRAKREAHWQKETRDPAALAKRLNAAARTDEVDTQRQRERLSPPATQDPRSVYWGPRLALQALEQQLAKLDAAGRQAGACGWRDTDFHPGQDVRWAVVAAGAPPNCLPMVQIRSDLLAGAGKSDEVRIFIAWMSEDHCGLAWEGETRPRTSLRCAHHLPLLRGIDWATLRKSWGW
jgi:hypothetical protein